MASKRDLIEAHAYNRRRLISAFLSGAPGGREVESVSRSRPVVAGLTLGGLLLAGAAVAGLLTKPLPDGWDNGYVILGQSSAARFVSIKGNLHPVLNATSARLILPSAKGFRVQVVDDVKIAATPHGSTLGILGAPDDLPPASSLVQSGWVSCLDGLNVATSISTEQVPTLNDGDGLTVKVDANGEDVRYLLAAGLRFRIPTDRYDSVKQYVNKVETPQTVPGAWVDLFNPGTDLSFASFAFVNPSMVEKPLPAQFRLGNKIDKVGQLIVNKDQGNAMSVMVDNGTIPLTAFAAAIYQGTAPGALGRPKTVSNADLAQIQPSDTRTFYPADWPTTVPASVTGKPCAVLETAANKPAATHLLLAPPESTRVKLPNSLGVYVQPGHGGLVRASATGTGGPVYVIDQSGQVFNITDPTAETLNRLGYANTVPRFVPPPWVAQFKAGPALSEAAVNAPKIESGGP